MTETGNFPDFKEAKKDTFRLLHGATESFYPAGKTLAINFTTLEQILDAKSSPHVYFDPFKAQVRLAILVSPLDSFIVEIFSI